MAITPEDVVKKYQEDREKIQAIRKAAEAEVQTIEASQKKREDYLLSLSDPSLLEYFTDLYLNGRDGKSTAEAQKKELKFQMDAIEKWLLKTLDSLKSTGMKTAFGTVFPTRKEGVSVEDFDAVLDFAVLRPLATAIDAWVQDENSSGYEGIEEIVSILKSSAHFEFLNKAVSKTAVLEVMGEQDPKDHSRPNPAPPGVKYTAIRTVGVRKS